MKKFEDLPPEIIQNICLRLPIDQVISISHINKNLSSVINHKSFWHRRFMCNASSERSCIPEKKVDWKAACTSVERVQCMFDPESDTSIRCTKQHYTAHCIDAIRILKRPLPELFAVGDRGGTFSVFDFRDFVANDDPKPVFTDAHTHSGWLWTISSDYDIITTGSWDKRLRMWVVADQGVSCISEYRMDAAVLCSDFIDPNLVAAATYKGTLGVYDFRAPPRSPSLSTDFHKAPVLCLKSPYGLTTGAGGLSSGYASSTTISFSDAESLAELSIDDSSAKSLEGEGQAPAGGDNASLSVVPPPGQNVAFYSGCKDRTLAAWDLRQFTQPITKTKLNGYPRAISLMDSDEMWVAAQPNHLHVFRTSSDSGTAEKNGFLSCATVYELAGVEAGTGICDLEATHGGVFVARAPASFDVLYPTAPPLSMLSQPIVHERNAPPVSLSFANDTLLIGSGNGNISLWMSAEQATRLNGGAA